MWGREIRKNWRRLTHPPMPTLPEMWQQSARYKGMPKWRFMLRKGWPTVLSALVLGTCDAIPGIEPVWARPFILVFIFMQGWQFFRWESSWQNWQEMKLPTVEQAKQIRDSMQEQVNLEIDPFMRQMGNEAVLEIDRWITGERQDDDR